MPDDLYNATVVFREDVGTNTAVLRIKPDAIQVPEFTPGQFVTIGLAGNPEADSPNDLVRRPYSIASPADERDHVEVFFARADDGTLSSRLWQLKVGSRLWMDDRIKGTFTLEGIPRRSDLLMISTGTGVAPFVSMLRTYRSQGRWRRFILINSARTAADLGYHAELDVIGRDDPSIEYLPTVSREPESSDWRGLRGRAQEALIGVLNAGSGREVDPGQCHGFLCGNPDMIESVSRMLEERGFSVGTKHDGGNLHFERYWT
jgi:ferredoxin--NADP+ reductase